MRTKQQQQQQQQSNSSSGVANNQKSYGYTTRIKSNSSVTNGGNVGATLTESRIITNINELLPGLNDISDAFEALPIDLIRYFTLLKEIDAKCINTIPQINHLINQYITNLHQDKNVTTTTTTTATNDDNTIDLNKKLETRRLNLIKNKINEVIPCLEEKMHVTSVASDLLKKHMYRINQDYKLILLNNEIPQSIRIGPLNHPAMINDTHTTSSSSTTSTGNGTGGGGGTNNNHGGNNSVQSQRSESRREALAARKANKEDDRENNTATGGSGRKKKKEQNNNNNSTASGADGNNGSNGKKRNRDDKSNNTGSGNDLKKKKKLNNNDQSDNRRRGEDENGKGDGETSFNSGNAKNDPHGKLKTTTTGNLVGGSSTTTTVSSSSTTSSSATTTTTSSTTTTKNSGSTGASTATATGASGAKGSSSSSSGNNEPTYCYCNQVSFGEMVGCDGDDCKREWFHLPCIGFKNPPKGKWYCDDCLKKLK